MKFCPVRGSSYDRRIHTHLPGRVLKSKVSVLAGSWWKSEHKEDIFKIISLAGGMRDLGPYAIKKSVKVHSLA